MSVLKKPLVTEKVSSLNEKGKYGFIVNADANKVEIKKAVEEFYGVTVTDVNTVVVPGKAKSRFTKAGYVQGRKPSYKKAVVTLASGDSIDLFSI